MNAEGLVTPATRSDVGVRNRRGVLTCLALLLILLNLTGCAPRPAADTPMIVTPAATSPEPTQATRPSPPPISTPGPPPEHRIGVRMVQGTGEFYDRHTGEKFVPRGFNYAQVAPMSLAEPFLWHSTLNPGYYQPLAVDLAFARMHGDGYNTVRAFVDCCRGGNNVGDPAGGISSRYVDNVVDFLERAASHEVFVLLELGLTPADGGYDELWESCCSRFDGENLRYMTPGGLAAKRKSMQDFLRALIDRGARLDAVFGFDLTNEVHFSADAPPLNRTAGTVTTANGQTYDLSSPQDRDRMVDENLVFWIDQGRAAIQEIDPTALVGVSFFEPQEPNPARIGDVRFIRTHAAIWESSADFIDLHAYPRMDLSLAEYVENYGIDGMAKRPIIMGEMGAFKSKFPSALSAAVALVDWQVESCGYGFDGWLLWTYDAHAQEELWNGMSQEAVIYAALAPSNRPDPCRVGSIGGENIALGKPVRTSRSLPSNPGEMAVNGSVADWWGSGGFAPAWIEIDLLQEVTIERIELIVGQSPAGETLHRVYARSAEGSYALLHEFRGHTQDDDRLRYSPAESLPGIRFIRVETVSSHSWVSWKEIEVIGSSD
jgi:hypothetical protein